MKTPTGSRRLHLDHSSTRGHVAVIATAVAVTVSSVFPAFLGGALGAELRDSLSISAAMFGAIPAAFFTGAALASFVLGHVGESIGPRRLMIGTLSVTIIAELLIATLVNTGPQLAAILFVAGVANSGTQASANKLIAEAIRSDRVGVAIAVKQSGMPAAAMLGGLAVPLLALRFGWRVSYGFGAAIAICALVAVIWVVAPAPQPHVDRDNRGDAASPTPRRSPDLSYRVLAVAATAAGFAAFGAGALATWFTSSAEHAGWSVGDAGLMLSLASATAIVLRLVLGVSSDRHPQRLPLRAAAVALSIGALGALTLINSRGAAQGVGGLIAIGIGWTWPAVFNIGVVRANPNAPSAATGLTQTGVYVGVLSSPLVMAVAVNAWGYGLAWVVAAAAMLTGGVLMKALEHQVVPPTIKHSDSAGDQVT